MKLNSKQFLDLDTKFAEFKTAAVTILPVPYEGGITYGAGTAQGPDDVINASQHLELYDEMLKAEPFRMGIATLMPLKSPSDPQDLHKAVYRCSKAVIKEDKFVVLLGEIIPSASVIFKPYRRNTPCFPSFNSTPMQI